ncbi:MAG: hypothetical protein QGD94_12770, partial [Planctomycetia bacterium]|nr:hypothetical protein [Planctomycetia bacterium]
MVCKVVGEGGERVATATTFFMVVPEPEEAGPAYTPPTALIVGKGKPNARKMELDVIEVPTVEKGPKIDGNLDDEIWKSAYKGKLEAEDPSDIYILMDGKTLYVGIRNYESFPEKMQVTQKGPTGAVWQDDDNELYLDSLGDKGSYCHFGWNSIGTTYFKPGVKLDAPKWQVKTGKTKKAWIAEFALDMASFKMGSVYTGFGMCIERKDNARAPRTGPAETTGIQVEGQKFWPTYIELNMGFHPKPVFYNRLTRAGTVRPLKITLVGDGFWGSRKITVDVKSSLGKGVDAVVTLACWPSDAEADEIDKLRFTDKAKVTLGPGET